jgi:hypothetical protein
MLTLEPGVYVRIVELPNGPTPFPLASGFNDETAYRAIGMFNPSETSDAYFILSNDRDELWFICNRHARVVGLLPRCADLRLPTSDAVRLMVSAGD